MEVQTIRCDAVNVGDRHRKDMGDLQRLAESAKACGGIFQPIVVRRDGKLYKLLAGERRFRVTRDLLHNATIPAVIVQAKTRLAELLIERDENNTHKPFNPVEAAELGMEIEQEIKKARESVPNGTQLSAGFPTT